MSQRKRWMAVGALASAFAVFSGSAAFAAGGWTTVGVPSPANTADTQLNGVFARTNTDAWAVGDQSVSAGTAAPIYHWDGTAWSQVSTPVLGGRGGDPLAVSASSATDAWAVGVRGIGTRGIETLMEHWNGTAWAVDTADATAGGDLTGVLDLSPVNAYAVGESGNGPLLLHWNGTSWSPVTLPDSRFVPGGGEAISASSPGDIWVTGVSSTITSGAFTEALHFNGNAWTVVPMAQPAAFAEFGLAAVTAISPSDAWAVGGGASANGSGTLIEHWNGTAWSVVPSPTPGTLPQGVSLSGVAARSASDVYAVGTEQPCVRCANVVMILRWNGTAWSDDTNDTIPGSAVAAATFPGAAREWAVGFDSNDQALALSHG